MGPQRNQWESFEIMSFIGWFLEAEKHFREIGGVGERNMFLQNHVTMEI